MSLKITTTGAVPKVIVSGRELTHPVNNFNILNEFKIEEIDKSELQELISLGHITVQYEEEPITNTSVISDIPYFKGTSPTEQAGLVPTDNQTPSGRLLDDSGNWVNPPSGARWKDYATNAQAEPENAWMNLINRNFVVPSSKDYEWTISCIYNLDATNKFAMFRLLIDSDEQFEVEIEPKDKNEWRPFNLSYIKNLSAGSHNFRLQARRSGGNKDFEIENIMLKLEET